MKKLNPRVKSVIPKENFTLELKFENGELKQFDMKTYLERGIFRELKNPKLFKTATICDGTVKWAHDQDLCPDTLYLKSKKISKK